MCCFGEMYFIRRNILCVGVYEYGWQYFVLWLVGCDLRVWVLLDWFYQIWVVFIGLYVSLIDLLVVVEVEGVDVVQIFFGNLQSWKVFKLWDDVVVLKVVILFIYVYVFYLINFVLVNNCVWILLCKIL